MFFDKQYNTTIIENITIEKLEEKTKKSRPYNHEDPADTWAYFSYLKGVEAGLSEMYAVNFGSIISSFVAGMGVDAGTDIYFKLDIDNEIFNIYEECKKTNQKETKQLKQFFNKVLQFYQSPQGACKYEKAIFQHNIRVGNKLKQWFKEQGTTTNTITKLMNNEITNKPSWQKGDENINFYLTYTNEEKWTQIEGDNDPAKIRTILR